MSESVQNKKWNCDQIIKFLEIYEQLPCLWDVHSISYKNREERVSAYEKLSNEMGIEGFTAKDAKSKIRSLRNAYTLEPNKISRSKKSGAGTDDVYKPKVPWFAVADRILHEVVKIRDSESTEIIQVSVKLQYLLIVFVIYNIGQQKSFI